jgi:hypothetical protein
MAADVSIIVETNAKEVGNEFTGMAGQIMAAVDKADKLDKAFKFLDVAVNKGKISLDQYSKAGQVLDKVEDELYASIGRTNTAVKAQDAAMDNAATSTTRASNAMSQAAIRAQNLSKAQRLAGKSTNKFGMISQQVGYQVGDFFVQVQSGTDALVAFGQQGTQLAGLLPGLGGAILGIGLSLGTALLNASLRAKELRVDFKAVAEDLGNALEPISPLIDAIGNALGYMGQIASQVLQSLLNNLDRLVAYFTTFVGLVSVKLVAGFVASGAAASAFFTLLKRGLISTGIGALVVLLGEVFLAFVKLRQATGSWGEAFNLLYEIANEAFTNMDIMAAAFRDGMESVAKDIQVAFLSAFVKIQEKMASLVNFLLASPILEAAGIDIGQKAEDWINSFDPGGIKAEIDKLQGESADLWASAGAGLSEAVPTLSKVQELIAKANETGGTVDTSDWLVPDTDDKKKGSKGSKKTFDELMKALKGEVADQKELLGVYGAKRESIEQIISFEKQLERTLTDNEKLKVDMAARELYRTEQNAKLLDMVVDNLESAFMSVVDGSMSVVDAFKNMLKQIILAVYQQEVARPAATAIGGLFNSAIKAIFPSANGNVFLNGSHVQAYANGGVVNRATMFPMSGGQTGLMGEAGPEAIMPLKRGKNGKLGVQMEGSSQPVIVNNNFNISANGDDSVKRIVRGEIPRITEATKAAVVDAKRRGGTYGRSF